VDILVFDVGCISCANLAIDLTGDGQGDVTTNPRPNGTQLVCSADCTLEFAPGATVTLQARPPDAASVFNGWSGDCSGSSPLVTITLGAGGSTRTCQAQFDSSN
jgi:hypothetical protein